MRLTQLIKNLGDFRKLIFPEADFEVKGISCNSKEVQDNFVFVAVKGACQDGHRFIAEAIEKGAKAVIIERKALSCNLQNNINFIEVEDTRSVLAELAARFYGEPSEKMKIVAVTGTNGKTTITYLIEALIKEAFKTAAVIGTVNYRFKEKTFPSENTTPGPLQLHAMFKKMINEETDYCVMEVSSHALKQERTKGIKFSCAIFSNLTQDHLDYHRTMDDYFLSKAKLFRQLEQKAAAVINIDDAYGRKLKELTSADIISYGIKNKADITAKDIKFNISHTEFVLEAFEKKIKLKTSLIGLHNIYNILAAIAFGLKEGFDLSIMKSAIEKFEFIPGRLEKIGTGKPFSVFVDYAHTPDALANAISALRQVSSKRLIVVFGCGGERDRIKRPKMGKIVFKSADYAIVTNDNPRSEDPRQIINEIVSGRKEDNYCVIPDRRDAIKRSFAIASKGDIVLIAGKGHENYQIINGKTIEFSDQEVVKKCLSEAAGNYVHCVRECNFVTGFAVNEIIEAAGGKLVFGLKNSHFETISVDSRLIGKGEAFLAIKGKNFDGHNFIKEAIRKGASCIIKKRGEGAFNNYNKSAVIEVQDTIKALADIARFNRCKYKMPVIAVSGSAGKTTVKEMVSWVLSAKYNVIKNEGTKNNNIGLPLTLLRANSACEIAVLELGTNHFGEIENLSSICKPNIGIITNIGPAHLEYFNDLSGVLKEKYVLIENLDNPYIYLLNRDDDLLRKKSSQKADKLHVFSFGIKRKSDFTASDINSRSGRLEFYLNKKYRFILNTLGPHNIYNALAAIGIARLFGIDYGDIKDRLASFCFPQGRFNIKTINNVIFIDDTYNSNPLSLKYALDAIGKLDVKGRKIFIMGDMLELGSLTKLFHSQAGIQVARVCDKFITVGRFSRLAAKTACSLGFNNKDIFNCDTAFQARDVLFNKLHPNNDDIVLVKGSRAMKMEEVFEK